MYSSKVICSLQLAILETLERTSPGAAELIVERMEKIDEKLEDGAEIGAEMQKVIDQILIGFDNE